MPVYKMSGKKDGLQQYRVRINYTDPFGNAKQLDRIAYGKDAAKQLEAKLIAETKEKSPTEERRIFPERSKVEAKSVKNLYHHNITPFVR